MSSPENSSEFANVASRIETLTNMLHHMKHKKHPSSEKDKIPPFLRHFATLLTCGGINDNEAKKVVAVTGSFESNERVKTLVVTQNPSAQTKVEQLDVKRVIRGDDTFDEVVMRHPNANSLHQHIADLRVVLSSCDPENEPQVKALQIFVVARCYRKIRTRVQLYQKLFKAQLYKEIAEWTGEGQELETQWINVPDWLVQLLPKVAHMNSRTATHSGKTITQWEFSDDTKRIWAKLLARILLLLNNAFDAARTARKNVEHEECRPTDAERKAYAEINTWLVVLCSYVQAQHNVVKTLLTQTSLGSTLAKISQSHAENEEDPDESADMLSEPNEVANENDADESADMIREPSEEPGEYVLRYLQTIVAWHSAINAIVIKSRGVFDMKNVDIGVVEVPYHKPGPLTTVNEMQKEYIRRKPIASRYLPLLKKNFPSRFGGTIHAEAALMGLMAYSSTDQGNVNYGERVGDMETLREILLPATFDMNIAVGKKCCWCCNRLAYHLGQYLGSEFNLPGTHGILFAWSPPRIGIDVSVLKMLENELWDELHSALRARARPSVSRQSSGESTEADDRFTRLGGIDDNIDADLWK